MFGDLFGGGLRGGRASQGPMKGANIRKSVTLISLVSIIGTALAICMIMVIVLVLEVRITDFVR